MYSQRGIAISRTGRVRGCCAVLLLLAASAPVAATPFNDRIDPDDIPPFAPPFPLQVASPVVVPPGESAAQGVLYAVRQVAAVPGRPSVELRSNPLLLSRYRSTP